MVESFADKRTAAIFQGLEVRGLPREIQGVARRKLKIIDAAPSIDALRVPPGNRLEPLKGNRKGQWSIRINDQWRICFRWKDGVNPSGWTIGVIRTKPPAGRVWFRTLSVTGSRVRSASVWRCRSLR